LPSLRTGKSNQTLLDTIAASEQRHTLCSHGQRQLDDGTDAVHDGVRRAGGAGQTPRLMMAAPRCCTVEMNSPLSQVSSGMAAVAGLPLILAL